MKLEYILFLFLKVALVSIAYLLQYINELFPNVNLISSTVGLS